MFKVIFYTKENCSLCTEAEQLLNLFQTRFSFRLEKRDIYKNDVWLAKYQLEIPVIEVNGKQLQSEEINYDSIETLLKEGEKNLS